MRYILFIFIIAFTDFVFGQGDAPPLLQGQYQGSKSVGSFIQTPNAGVTKINSSTALIETGNNNILVNPSFEHQVFSTGWTVGSGTFTEETVNEIHGKKAAKLVLSSQAMSLTQSSTLYQAQFADSVQGLASVRVKSDVALKVCSIQAGVVSTSNCVDVQANNKWGLYKVPMSLGATSNGISIASTGAVTGTVYIDDAFVGISNILDVQPVISGWNNFTMNITATTTNPTKATTKINDEARWRQVGDSIEIHYNYHHNNNAGASAGSGVYLFNLPPGFTINTAKMAAAPDSNVRSSIGFSSAQGPGGGASGVVKIYSSTAFSLLVDFEDAATISEVSSSNFGLANASASYAFRAVVPVNELSGSTSTYSSLNKDTDWQSCGHTSSSFPNFGTVTSIETQCKRVGSDLLMRGNFTSGTTLAAEARINLPLWNGVQLVSAGTQKIASIQLAGSFIKSVADTGTVSLIEPSVTYITMGFQNSTGSGLSKANANVVAGLGVKISFSARIPIEGWDNSNLIIGQFNGLERCIDSYECTDVFSAKVSAAGVVSNENINWINGNCTVGSPSAGSFSCPIFSSIRTTSMNCTVSPSSGGLAYGVESVSDNLTNLIFTTFRGDTNAPFAAAVNIICQKQGVDYIGKTAKAVASDQNVRSIGSVGVDIQSVYFGSGANCATACTSGTCTICNQVGSKITSVSFSSTGIYNLNGIDGFKYNCSGSGAGTSYTTLTHRKDTSTTSYAQMYAGSGGGVINSAHNSVTCIGIP